MGKIKNGAATRRERHYNVTMTSPWCISVKLGFSGSLFSYFSNIKNWVLSGEQEKECIICVPFG